MIKTTDKKIEMHNSIHFFPASLSSSQIVIEIRSTPDKEFHRNCLNIYLILTQLWLEYEVHYY